jgi:DNA-binding LacI/PurR family transcriptional regulator
MKLTIKDLAKKAGVSVATVSRALNPATEHLVESATLNKVKELSRQWGYFPQRAARSLREGLSRTIGILMYFRTDTISGYVGEIMKGILKGLQEVGYDLKLISREEFPSFQAILDSGGIDGIIITHAYRDAFPYFEKEIRRNKGKILPLVVINDYNPAWRINQLYVDSYKASIEITAYLVKRGYRDFYLIEGEEASPDARIRKQGFLKILKESGMDLASTRFINGHFSEEGGSRAAQTILKNDPGFRGLFYCLNDAMAIGALRAIGESGLNCPRDIKLIGFDGIPQTEYANPALTTMKFPLSEMGYEAVGVIYKIIRGKTKRYVRREFPAELVIRNSC